MGKKIILFLILTVFSISTAGEVLKSFEEHLKKVKSVRGKFLQITTIEGFDEPQTFIGEIYITKPDTLKIIYKDPFKQIILVKGSQSTIYTPEEKQAIISKLSEDFIIVKIFKHMIKNKSLKEIFKVKEEKKTKEGVLIVLEPIEDKEIKKVELIIKNKNKLYKLKIYGKDSTVELQFAEFEYLDKKLELNIDLPADVEIIRQ